MTSNFGRQRATRLKSEELWEDDSAAKFICHQCQKTFYNLTALVNHRKMHHSNYECTLDELRNPFLFTQNPNDDAETCDFKFSSLIPNTMEKLHTLNGVTTCKFLEDTSFLIVRLRKGSPDHTDPIALENLEHEFSTIHQNKDSVHFRGPFKCTFRSTAIRPELQCQQIFFNCCEYSLHYREEHTKRRKAALRCQVCEKPLDRDAYVKNTVAPVQNGVFAKRRTFSCQLCSQTFLASSHFDEHNRVFHAKTKPYACNICGKRFSQQGGLQQHMRMHTGIRPFTCTFCPKAFTQKAGLEQHTRTHTKVKPFRCVICGKCFSQSVHLRQHMRTHTNIQPFGCSFCGKRFKQSSHLTFHMRSHVNETGSLVVERYAQEMNPSDQMQFRDISNVQPVMEGETMYYAAELAPATQSSTITPFFPFAYQS